MGMKRLKAIYYLLKGYVNKSFASDTVEDASADAMIKSSYDTILGRKSKK